MCELIKNPDMKVYYNDKNILIMDEPNNGRYNKRILCLWKTHTPGLTPNNLSKMMSQCWSFKESLIGDWDIIISLRTQPQHFHIHLGGFK